MEDLPLEIALSPSHVQTHYSKMIADGQSPRFAEMCSLQIAPGTQGTDRTFFEGRYNNQQFDDMPKKQADFMIRAAKEAGINISGKYYHSGLADGRRWQDPEAWVSSTDDVLRVCKKRHKSISGAINYDAGDALPPQRKILSERIIKEEVARERSRNPSVKDTPALRQKIIERHAHPSKLKGQ